MVISVSALDFTVIAALPHGTCPHPPSPMRGVGSGARRIADRSATVQGRAADFAWLRRSCCRDLIGVHSQNRAIRYRRKPMIDHAIGRRALLTAAAAPAVARPLRDTPRPPPPA